MWCLLPIFLLPALVTADTPTNRPPQLARVAEEADAMRQSLPKTLSREILRQHSVAVRVRFHPRFGKTAQSAPYQDHEVVSEYTVRAFGQGAGGDLHELRQVISVDGTPLRSPEEAGRALSPGIRSEDDRARKRTLEDLAKHGLVDVAVDYGLILLAFTPRGLENMEIAPGPESRIGAAQALGFNWKQASPEGGQLAFNGRRTVRLPLQGVLWVRKSDGLPLRVEAWAEYEENRHRIRDEATVEYVRSSHGFLTPTSVVHRHSVDGALMTENRYTYRPFRLFSSDTDIRFTETPASPQPAKK